MTKPRVTIVGSLNMDIVVSMPRLPQIGETISGSEVHYVPGGKGANQALGCSRLTCDTTMIGCVGQDVFGDVILEQMQSNGVQITSIAQLEHIATGTAHISHTPDDNCIVVVPGANGECGIDLVKRHTSILSSSAIILAQLETPIEAVQEAFQIAKSGSGKTILNPAPARPLSQELLAVTDFITPNDSEWELISGQSYETDEALEQGMIAWEEQYYCKVIVTRGVKGSSYLDGGKLVTTPAPRVKVVDTTGAGDCFNAALAYGIGLGKELRDAVPFAVKAASLSVQKFGAQDGMPTLVEVESYELNAEVVSDRTDMF